MKRLGALLASLLLAGSLTACGGTAAQEMQSIQVVAMDTVMGLRACGGETEAALAAAEDEIYRLDEALSRTREDSAVSRLNSAAGGTPVDVGEELRDLIARALDFSAATDGAFDITLAPVSSAWGFTEDTYRVPEDAELALLLPCVGAEHVHLEEGTAVSLDQGTRIDLGAIAKGYASDWMAAIYQEHGITPKSIQKEIREVLEISTNESVDKKLKKRMSPKEREAMIAKLTAEMRAAAKILEFEHAAYLRDKIQKLREEK